VVKGQLKVVFNNTDLVEVYI